MLRTAVIGMGNMGCRYARLIASGEVEGMELAAVTRIRPEHAAELEMLLPKSLKVYDSSDELLQDVERGALHIQAVIVATPHYSHEGITIRAHAAGLHVLCEKPLGVYSRQGRLMQEAADRSCKRFAVMFQMRTNPAFQLLHNIVHSGKYGAIKRVHWLVTNWYRPDGYYRSSPWHATWKKDGGGVLLNQCPHNLDILQWICGMPGRVQGFCHEGHYHDIEVEDDATAYMEWSNGATGTFVTSTGDAPGIDRLEIFLEDALLVCEDGKVRICELTPELHITEPEYRKTSKDFFRTIRGAWIEPELPATVSHDPYKAMLLGFAGACSSKVASPCSLEGAAQSSPEGTTPCSPEGATPFIVEGAEGRKSLLLSNAIYLSSWKRCMVDIPLLDTPEERAFEEEFESLLRKKCEGSSQSRKIHPIEKIFPP